MVALLSGNLGLQWEPESIERVSHNTPRRTLPQKGATAGNKTFKPTRGTVRGGIKFHSNVIQMEFKGALPFRVSLAYQKRRAKVRLISKVEVLLFKSTRCPPEQIVECKF